MIQSILAVVLVLGGLIFFHELGHFVFARLFGVGVKTFSLGFGPKLFGLTRGQTLYKVSLVPLGGYVSMAGEAAGEPVPEGFGPEQSFTARPAWHRMCIIAAGPIFNFLLAILIYWGLFWSGGQQHLLPHIESVQDGSPAQVAGLEQGDLVTAVDGEPVRYWDELAERIAASGEDPISLTVERDDAALDVTVTPEVQVRENIFGEEVRVPMIGIQASGKTVREPLNGLAAGWAAVQQTWTVISLTVQGVIKIIERVIPVETIGGPIMIAQMVSQQAEQGLVNILLLAAFISINLGFINLLPIPVLDGGHILFLGIETILGRPLSEKWQQITIRIGLAILLGLMFLAIYNDLTRIFKAP